MGWFPQAEGEVACCPPGAGGAAHTDEAAGWPCCGACASPAPAHSKVAIEKVTNRCLLFISLLLPPVLSPPRPRGPSTQGQLMPSWAPLDTQSHRCLAESTGDRVPGQARDSPSFALSSVECFLSNRHCANCREKLSWRPKI